MRLGQAEPDTENFLFGSEKTAILLLDDVRVGDIVDYAYTITGGNPAMNGKFAGEVRLQFRQPVDREVTRLLWPTSRRLYMLNHLATLDPATVRKGNLIQFTWDLRATPGLLLEPPTPIWYDPYPSVQLSEFRTWADVNQWALQKFTITNAPSPELTRKINVGLSLPAPADRVLAALRFVQEEIRRPGAEDVISTYEPAKPSVVFARRYGDPKDKALLLVTILRALRIEAFPVLVNTRRWQEVAELQPSATVFDHVIVQVNLDGQSFWLDATANYERGLLTERSWPSYGWGLRVGPGVTALTPIPPCPVLPETTVTEYLDLGDLNHESFAKIVTVAAGPDANRLREHYATTPRLDIEQENLNAYASLYPRIRRTAPLLYHDDEPQNRIEITDFYAIGGMWSRMPGETYYRCPIYALNVDDALIKPEVSLRTMPLGLRYPVHQIFRAEVSLPASLPLELSNVTIQNPAFFFQRTVGLPEGKLSVGYEYHSWSDVVQPDAVPAYVRDLNAATDALGFKVAGFF
jgi:transglutaminase-like putative cysteine protease